MATTRILFSGFGGQGILTLGQLIASIALNKGKEVTWMPSYGAEMRGGTANCSVIISDKMIGSPITSTNIDILCAMNIPSIVKFLDNVKPGGQVYVNSSIVKEPIDRTDVEAVLLDATNIANKLGNIRVANMVMLAAFLQKTDLFTFGDVEEVLHQRFAEKYPQLAALNVDAVKQGLEALA
ncbi:MAG: 2-oxoacid:acceptor oxidoreductase family protein [Clostridiales bacterium]|jgi:2-oxoglutarate ferredoxin oxidoreductase subunit gamma|nr:2-oxoacid:acceptor oxidoreductase family protein [Clostridiales bacterium]